jgi:caffeoyl-CoA O-methyltransferase
MPQPVTTPALETYATAHTSAEPEYLRTVAEYTREHLADRLGMLTGHLAGAFLTAVAAMVRPRLVVEVGTFSGYSALAMARGMAAAGRMICLDIDPEHVAIARRHIAASPHAGQIEVRQGAALDLLAAIDGPIDLAFIDADKGNYLNYLQAILPKLSGEGVIVVDNVLWYGQVVEGNDMADDTVAIRAFNDAVVADDRLECVMVPIRDGMTLIRRRTTA